MLVVLITGLPGSGKSTMADVVGCALRGARARPRLGDERPAALPRAPGRPRQHGPAGTPRTSMVPPLGAGAVAAPGRLPGRARRRRPWPRGRGNPPGGGQEGARSLVVITSCPRRRTAPLTRRRSAPHDPGLVRARLGPRHQRPGLVGPAGVSTSSSRRRPRSRRTPSGCARCSPCGPDQSLGRSGGLVGDPEDPQRSAMTPAGVGLKPAAAEVEPARAPPRSRRGATRSPPPGSPASSHLEQPAPDPGGAGRASARDERVDHEGVRPAVPGHVDEADQAAQAYERADPAQAVPLDPAPPVDVEQPRASKPVGVQER